MTVEGSCPVPVPDEQSAPFWEAAARGELALARCASCSRFVHPPAPVCPECGSTDPAFAFHPVDGHGVIRSWTVLRQSSLAGFAADLPIVLVDVALELGADLATARDTDVRLIGRLLDGSAAPLHVGDGVRVVFEQLADGVAVPAFTLAPR